MQEDSYRGDPTDPLSLNYYAYCAGNPLTYSDPSGHFGEGIAKSWNDYKSNFSEGLDILTNTDKRNEAINLVSTYGDGSLSQSIFLGSLETFGNSADFAKNPVKGFEEFNNAVAKPYIKNDLGIKENSVAYKALKYVGVRAEGITATGVNLDKGMVQGAGLIAKTYIDQKMFEINPNKANFNKVMANGGTWLQAGKGIVSDALYVADPINSLNYHFNLNLSVSEAANYSQSVINTAMIAEPAANLAQFGADAASSLYSKAIPRISNAMETASEAARNTAMQPNMPGFGNIGGFTNPFDSILSYTKTFKEVIGSDKPTYSRSIPEGWQKLKMDKSFNQIREENGWKQGNITINNSKERSAKIFDSNGNKIGDVHFGHKETYGNGPDKKVTQDHYHLDADEDNIHYVLPDKK